MCGIVGCVGESFAGKKVLEKLKLLQYRGYDSAGVGFNDNGELLSIKCVGEVANLEQKVTQNFEKSSCVIGHTRWATHGGVCEENAHPIVEGKVAVVHNGIFENCSTLGDVFLNKELNNCVLDTAVFAKCLNRLLSVEKVSTKTVLDSLSVVLSESLGSWALCFLVSECDNTIFFAKNKSPLIIGKSEHGYFLCSDITSLAGDCKQICELNDGDYGWVSEKTIKIYNKFGKTSDRKWRKVGSEFVDVSLGEYSCFMEKEIEESFSCALDTIQNFAFPSSLARKMQKYPVYVCACGSAFNAGLCFKHWMGSLLSCSVDCVYASEYANRNVLGKASVGFFISQSGETADTLYGVELAKDRDICVGIVNTPNSSLTKKCDYVLYTKAGKECAVAATKTYACQLVCGLSIVEKLSNKNKDLLNTSELCTKLNKIDFSKIKHDVLEIAKIIKNEESVYFVGRGVDYYIAKEGALKLREVSYIHVEALPAGELKHGSLALIDSSTFVVVILTQSKLIKKTLNNVAEIKSRGGKIIMFSPFSEAESLADFWIEVPRFCDEFMPVVMAKPLQLLACYTALSKGLNPDKPRNLAKSVTVE